MYNAPLQVGTRIYLNSNLTTPFTGTYLSDGTNWYLCGSGDGQITSTGSCTSPTPTPTPTGLGLTRVSAKFSPTSYDAACSASSVNIWANASTFGAATALYTTSDGTSWVSSGFYVAIDNSEGKQVSGNQIVDGTDLPCSGGGGQQ